MKLKKHERIKALSMIDNWSYSYLLEIDFFNSVKQELSTSCEEIFESKDIADNLELLETYSREMCILLRIRELTITLRKNSKYSAKLDRLITRFFQSRQIFLSKWDAADRAISKIMGYLDSQR